MWALWACEKQRRYFLRKSDSEPGQSKNNTGKAEAKPRSAGRDGRLFVKVRTQTKYDESINSSGLQPSRCLGEAGGRVDLTGAGPSNQEHNRGANEASDGFKQKHALNIHA